MTNHRGGEGETRTHDPMLAKHTLLPSELQPHWNMLFPILFEHHVQQENCANYVQKAANTYHHFVLVFINAELGGLEPPTLALTVQRSDLLSYRTSLNDKCNYFGKNEFIPQWK